MRVIPVTFAVLSLLACGDPARTADEARAPPADEQPLSQSPCSEHQGSAVTVTDDPKQGFSADLIGDLTGTLLIQYLSFDTGVVDRFAGEFTLNREAGALLFGDGVRGQRVPTGRPSDASYRYGAGSAIDGGTGALEGASGWLELDGWIDPSGGAADIRYRITLCGI